MLDARDRAVFARSCVDLAMLLTAFARVVASVVGPAFLGSSCSAEDGVTASFSFFFLGELARSPTLRFFFAGLSSFAT